MLKMLNFMCILPHTHETISGGLPVALGVKSELLALYRSGQPPPLPFPITLCLAFASGPLYLLVPA